MNAAYSDRARLLHIRDTLETIFEYVDEDSSRSRRTQDAIIYQLQIIGEACNHISEATKVRYPETLWQSIVDMRHHLVHGYMQVDIKEVWDTVDDDLIPLQDQILTMLDDGAIL